MKFKAEDGSEWEGHIHGDSPSTTIRKVPPPASDPLKKLDEEILRNYRCYGDPATLGYHNARTIVHAALELIEPKLKQLLANQADDYVRLKQELNTLEKRIAVLEERRINNAYGPWASQWNELLKKMEPK